MRNKMFALSVILLVLLTACGAPLATELVSPATEAVSPVVEPVGSDPTPGVNSSASAGSTSLTYQIVDTGQIACYDNDQLVACAAQGASFAGQDGNFQGAAPAYQDNGDGTVTDLNTGLMWQQDPGEKVTYAQAVAEASSLNLAGYNNWRLPTIKELYSLILFDGTDVSVCNSGTCSTTPFIDTRYFNFSYGDTNGGERVIDSQFATSSKYVSTTMNGDETMFGVNFADGRIKGYGLSMRGGDKTFYVLYVRGNSNYGQNSFVDNGNGTISDNATGLVWSQADSGVGMNWADALTYCEDLSAAGFDDWRLPSAKELQSIVDYSRSPDTTNSAAIDPSFNVTSITNEAGQTDYPFYWSSTTHADSVGRGSSAAYVSFGRALGYMNSWMDVHGAGAQRSDPKTGSASDFPQGHGPQGDAVRVDNYVRCVRGGDVTYVSGNTTVTNRPGVSVEGASINNTGQQGQGQPTMDAQQGPGGANGGQGPDIAAAAITLGVTEDALRAALGPPGQGRPDFASAAQTLGITEAELISALGIAGGGLPPISTP